MNTNPTGMPKRVGATGATAAGTPTKPQSGPSSPKTPAASPLAPTERPKLDPAADYSTPDCAVNCFDNGEGECVFLLDKEVLRRIRTRAQTQDLADYLWLNVIRPALYGHVY